MNYFIDIRFNEYLKTVDGVEEIYSINTLELIDLSIVAEDGREFYAKAEFDEDELKFIDNKLNCLPAEKTKELQYKIMRFFNPIRTKEQNAAEYIMQHSVDQLTKYAFPTLITYNSSYIIPVLRAFYNYLTFPGFPEYVYQLIQLEKDKGVNVYTKGRPELKKTTNNVTLDNARWYKELFDFLKTQSFKQ